LAQGQCEVPIDVDGDGDIAALTDGLLILRSLFGLTGTALTSAAVDLANCTRCTAPEIQAHLASILFQLDVDEDGDRAALTDGLLILRSLFGLTGTALTSGAVDLANCERCTATAIQVYLENVKLVEQPLDVWEPTTEPFDPLCPGCVEVEESENLAHLGVEVTYLYDAAIDDPIAQWADCLGSMLDCLEQDGTISACAAAAACPSECKALYASRAPPGADEATLLDVLNGVYVECGAPCRPLEEVEP
jgi:hypothetical protein